jgi:phosphoribosyl-ATP pyrophosphohydrolase
METEGQQIGYHLSEIPKGELGQLSKIKEEYMELVDASKQNSKIMIGVELADLYGAIESYAESQGLSMDDLKTFSDITKRAFKNGRR